MLLAYYPSAGLTQAEKNVSRWQTRLTCAQNAYLSAQNEALTLYPEWPVPQYPAQPNAEIAAARLAHVQPLADQIAQYADLVRNAQRELPGERAAAYLAHVERQAAEQAQRESWLAKTVGSLLTALIELFPSRVSQPAVFA